MQRIVLDFDLVYDGNADIQVSILGTASCYGAISDMQRIVLDFYLVNDFNTDIQVYLGPMELYQTCSA